MTDAQKQVKAFSSTKYKSDRHVPEAITVLSTSNYCAAVNPTNIISLPICMISAFHQYNLFIRHKRVFL